MLLGRDAFQFEVGYRLGYSEAKEEDAEEHLGGSGEVAASEGPVEEVPEPSRVREAWGLIN